MVAFTARLAAWLADSGRYLLWRRADAAKAAGARNHETYRNSILDLVDEDGSLDEISQIEARLEDLAETAERCRKIIAVSKLAIAGSGALLLLAILGLFGVNETAALGSIAVGLGGIVSLGSNISTLRQTMDAISDGERLRSDLIDRKHLRMVGDSPMKLI